MEKVRMFGFDVEEHSDSFHIRYLFMFENDRGAKVGRLRPSDKPSPSGFVWDPKNPWYMAELVKNDGGFWEHVDRVDMMMDLSGEQVMKMLEEISKKPRIGR